jgi:prepilin signal peptidase PulO-like enzyme (type II secretory pathway)
MFFAALALFTTFAYFACVAAFALFVPLPPVVVTFALFALFALFAPFAPFAHSAFCPALSFSAVCALITVVATLPLPAPARLPRVTPLITRALALTTNPRRLRTRRTRPERRLRTLRRPTLLIHANRLARGLQRAKIGGFLRQRAALARRIIFL